MSKLAFDSGEELPAAQIAQIRHRAGYVRTLLECLQGAPRLEPELYRSYDDWYLHALEDGLFRRVYVIEVREWRRHVEDLLRDQLARAGIDSGWWDSLREAAGPESEVERLARALEEGLGVGLAATVWQDLEELVAVARTIAEGTQAARAALRQRYPHYFEGLDVFGDGDPGGRLTLTAEHARRAFVAVEAFWAALPYAVVGEDVA